MATLAPTAPNLRGFREFAAFLKEELTPYPGRTAIVMRMVLAATLVATICLTFRIPYGFQGAVFVLLISRESLRTTVTAGVTLVGVGGIGVLYLLATAGIAINDPMLHFLWHVGSYFLGFYVLSIASSYLVAVAFAIIIAVGLPLWDSYVSAETKVENVLWLLLAMFVGAAATAATEVVFVRAKPGQEFNLPLVDRLAAVHSLLVSYEQDGFVNESAEKRIVRFGILGTSGLRRALWRSGYDRHYRDQIGGLIGLVGRLVDMAGALAQLRFTPTESDRVHLGDLASAVAAIREDVLHRRIPRPLQFHRGEESPHCLPLLTEMESIVALIPQSFAGSAEESMPPPDMSSPLLFVADAFVNPDHLKFALKGCLAASACYFIYNAIDWPGISTAVITCLLTALTTIGASRQKQILRLAGVLVGGIVIGMGAQVFVLPYLDSIGGFLILFAVVTALSAWFATCGPRISYFGIQVALAFYLINLSEFTIQLSLSVARDRVVGVLLGLFMMWLVFDQLWSAPAGVEMRRAFIAGLRLLAQFSKEPVSGDIPAVIQRSLSLRGTISSSFDKVRALADGVLFEFGPSRRRDLQFRDQFRQWQPKLRTLFVMRIAFLEDYVQLTRFDLPETVQVSLREYNDYSSQVLEGIADRIEGQAREATGVSPSTAESLEQALNASLLPAARVQSLVALLRKIDALTTSLDKEMVLAQPA
ncbi:MAG TPA: FUSC family protein [Bryobacteraceae bacterium]